MKKAGLIAERLGTRSILTWLIACEYDVAFSRYEGLRPYTTYTPDFPKLDAPRGL